MSNKNRASKTVITNSVDGQSVKSAPVKPATAGDNEMWIDRRKVEGKEYEDLFQLLAKPNMEFAVFEERVNCFALAAVREKIARDQSTPSNQVSPLTRAIQDMEQEISKAVALLHAYDVQLQHAENELSDGGTPSHGYQIYCGLSLLGDIAAKNLVAHFNRIHAAEFESRKLAAA
jgi:hypothetical protein